MSTPSALSTLRHEHVALRVVDSDAAVAWYTEKLGFAVTQQWPFGELRLAYLAHGSAKIELLGGASATPQPAVASLDESFGAERLHHLCLAVDDLDAVVAELAARDVPLLGDPFVVEEIDRRLAFLQDPFGNLIELSAPR